MAVAELIDGQERAGAEIQFPLGDGQVPSFNSEASRAFDGQALRAEVERAIVQQYGQTLESLAPNVREAVESAIQAACAIAGVACPTG